MRQGDSKREYSKHIHDLVRSDSKKLQFIFSNSYEANQCLKCVRVCIDRKDYSLTAYRVNTTVYVEKI